MKTVGLMHGAYRGAACWAKLIPELGRPAELARAIAALA